MDLLVPPGLSQLGDTTLRTVDNAISAFFGISLECTLNVL